MLGCRRQAFLSQSQKNGLLIDRFQKTRAQFINYLKGAANHSLCDLLMFQHFILFILCIPVHADAHAANWFKET